MALAVPKSAGVNVWALAVPKSADVNVWAFGRPVRFFYSCQYENDVFLRGLAIVCVAACFKLRERNFTREN